MKPLCCPNGEHWYVVYTIPKLEKKINNCFQQEGIESFLPLHTVTRQWSDRKKKLDVPLFPNYIFVRLTDSQRNRVFCVNGVIRYISGEHGPYRVSERVINSIKIMLNGDLEVTYENFYEGEHLRVCRGPLCGLEGTLVEKKGKCKLAIRVEVMQRSILLEVSAGSLEKITPLLV